MWEGCHAQSHKWHGHPARAYSSTANNHQQIIRTNVRSILVQSYMRQQTQPRGMTRTEVITLLVLLVIIFSIFGVIPWALKANRNAISLKDATQIQQISTSMLVFSRELGPFPVPSLIAPPTANGEEDYKLNHSANLYSLMIMRHYITPQLLVSPLEVSKHITEANYDYNKFDPLNGSYWDNSLSMHIEDPRIGANGSYANVAAIGDRRDALHSSKILDTMPILGTRAYDQSILDPSDYLRSPVFRFSKPYDKWYGSIALADGHTETIETFYPQLTAYESNSSAVKDNIFAAEFDHPNGKQAAADAFLCISTAATQYTVKDVYDPLLDE